jgi:cytochrome c
MIMRLPTVLLAAVPAMTAAVEAAAADAAHGQELYESRCGGCHSLDANRVGPAHRGVYGRKAGSAPNFNYSTAVKNSAVVWDEKTLDAWLTNPQTLIPGQRMNFRVAASQDRADIIAYLRQESGASSP